MTVMDTLQREILEVKMEQEMISLAGRPCVMSRTLAIKTVHPPPNADC